MNSITYETERNCITADLIQTQFSDVTDWKEDYSGSYRCS